MKSLNRNNNLLSSLITGTKKTIYTDTNAEVKKKIDCIRCIILETKINNIVLKTLLS